MSDVLCKLPSDPDVSGAGVRAAVYFQGIAIFVIPVASLWDGVITSGELQSAKAMATTNLLLAFTIVISALIQGARRRLSNYHATIILNLSWMNNTIAFIYLLMYVQHKGFSIEKILVLWLTRICRRIRSLGETHPAAHIRGNRETDHEGGAYYAVMALASLHFVLLSALGVWLWRDPRAFGTPASASCAVDNAQLSILGIGVRFSSPRLRKFSLALYSVFLIPLYNILFPSSVVFHLHSYFRPRGARFDYPSDRASHHSLKPSTRHWRVRLRRLLPVLSAVFGLLFLLLVNIIFIVDIETTLRRNKHIQDSGESEWGFGQFLAVLVAVIPTLRDLLEAKLGGKDSGRAGENRGVEEWTRGAAGGGEDVEVEVGRKCTCGKRDGSGEEQVEMGIGQHGVDALGQKGGLGIREDTVEGQRGAVEEQERGVGEGEVASPPRSVLVV